MKRILSLIAVVALLASLFCVNASAAIPTSTENEWTVHVSDNFDGDKPVYFTRLAGDTANITYVAETEGSSNKVLDLRLGGTTTKYKDSDGETAVPIDNARIGVANYNNNNNIATDVPLGENVMIEFDMCGKNLIAPLSIAMRTPNSEAKENGMAVRINPNNIEANKWYTFKIVVERDFVNGLDINLATTKVYKKLRDSEDAFEVLEGESLPAYNNTTTKGFGIGGCYVNSMIEFGIVAHNSYICPYITGMDRTTSVGVAAANATMATHKNYIAGAEETHYQIDNITVYGKNAENDYELKQGIIANWDMEDSSKVPLKSNSLKIEDTNGDGVINNTDKWIQYPINTIEAENNGNSYMKFDPSVAPFAAITDYFAKFVVGSALPETFIISFDANNAELGAALDIVIGGDGTEKNAFPRNTLYFRSHEGIKNVWYSYKVICKATPQVDGSFAFEIYRKERGTDAPYTKLDGVSWAGKEEKTAAKDYGYASTMSGNVEWANTLQVGHNRRGLLSYYTKTYVSDTNKPVAEEEKANHENVVWYIDNLMITEANALTADFAVAENVLSADVNLSTVANTSAPVLAVYDGGKLVDVDFAAIAANVGSANLAVDYDASALTNPTAKFFVWESMGGAPLVTDVDVAKYIAD